jgi:hypothetical protein
MRKREPILGKRQPSEWYGGCSSEGVPSFRSAILVSAFVLTASASSLPAAGCSSTSAGARPDKGNDASPVDDADALSDSEPSDAGPSDASPDGGTSIWSSAATGFEIDSSGGGPAPPPSDADVCVGDSETIAYDVASRSLERRGCAEGKRLDASVVLAPGSVDALVARLTAIHAKGPQRAGSCGADAPEVTLFVLGADGGRAGYNSDFYSGCTFTVDAGGPPFVTFNDVEDLSEILDGYLAACDPDGGVLDAGASCVGLLDDASAGDGG